MGPPPVSRVYPRTCGETLGQLGRQNRTAGLSPHLRGNRRFAPGRQRHRGSIPAPAGKPWRGASPFSRTPVYPRTCGETPWQNPRLVSTNGLSPHLRGNHQRQRPRLPCLRSIPAPAGKPLAVNRLFFFTLLKNARQIETLVPLQKQHAVRVNNLFARFAKRLDSQVSRQSNPIPK